MFEIRTAVGPKAKAPIKAAQVEKTAGWLWINMFLLYKVTGLTAAGGTQVGTIRRSLKLNDTRCVFCSLLSSLKCFSVSVAAVQIWSLQGRTAAPTGFNGQQCSTKAEWSDNKKGPELVCKQRLWLNPGEWLTDSVTQTLVWAACPFESETHHRWLVTLSLQWIHWWPGNGEEAVWNSFALLTWPAAINRD